MTSNKELYKNLPSSWKNLSEYYEICAELCNRYRGIKLKLSDMSVKETAFVDAKISVPVHDQSNEGLLEEQEGQYVLKTGALETIAQKCIQMICNRAYSIYYENTQPKDVPLLAVYDRHVRKQNVDYDDLYIKRSVTAIDENGFDGKVFGDADVFKQSGVHYIFAPAGMGKSQYITQIRRAVDYNETELMIVLSCAKTVEYEDIVTYAYKEFKEKIGTYVFFSDKDFVALTQQRRLILVLDGLDEIVADSAVVGLFDKINECRLIDETTTIIITGRDEAAAAKILCGTRKRGTDTVDKTKCIPPKLYRLNALSEEQIKEYGHKILAFKNEDLMTDFFVRVDSISEEIKTNPLLLSQLATIYKNDIEERRKVNEFPRTVVEVLDRVTDIILRLDKRTERMIAKVEYDGMLNNLPTLLREFASRVYEYASLDIKIDGKIIFEEILEGIPSYNCDAEARADFLMSYLENRAIYGKDGFYHKMFLEYFTAVHYYKKKLTEKLFKHYSETGWSAVIKMFLIKADSEKDEYETGEMYTEILEKCGDKITDFSLLFDVCRDLLRNRRAAEFAVLKHIIEKSASGEFPPYGPIFYYVPQYELYETALDVAQSLIGNVRALALVRDVCVIMGEYGWARQIKSDFNGDRLYAAANGALSGIRDELMRVFYLTDVPTVTPTCDVFPRWFNPVDALKLRLEGTFDTTTHLTPFEDELQLYSHENYPELNGEYIGLVSLSADSEKERKILRAKSTRYVTALAFELITDWADDWALPRFYSRNVLTFSLPENLELILDEINVYGLKSIIVSDSVTKIGWASFINCTSLRRASLSQNIERIGEEAFENCTSLEKIGIPDSVTEIGGSAFRNCRSLKYVKLSQNIEHIGEKVFENCTGLEEIGIPDSVTEIGVGAFENCTSLKHIKLSQNLKKIGWCAFAGCTSLNYVKLSQNLQEIDSYAFANCISLEEMEIPDSVTEIGDGAFANCTELKSITLPAIFDNVYQSFGLSENVQITWKESKMIDVFTIPAYTEVVNCDMITDRTMRRVVFEEPVVLKRIDANAFRECWRLEEIEIPNTVTEIGVESFRSCIRLGEIKIPDSMTEISEYTFANCRSLNYVKLPQNLRRICGGAFENCMSLEKIEIPDSVTEIGMDAFEKCTALKSITLPMLFKDEYQRFGLSENVQITWIESKTIDVFTIPAYTEVVNSDMITDRTMRRVVFEKPVGVIIIGDGALRGCWRLEEIEIPDTVTIIGEYAFSNCTSLKCVKLSQNLKKLGWSAFASCTSLEEIKIPDSVTEVGWYAFADCTSLKCVKLSQNLMEIGKHAFKNCTSLEEIVIPDSVMEIGEGAFKNCTELKSITLPAIFDNVYQSFGLSENVQITWIESKMIDVFTIPAYTKIIYKDMITDRSMRRVVFEEPAVVMKIDADAFRHCYRLEEIKIPDSVTEIGEFAFENCTSLKSVKLSQNLQKIDWCAFEGCDSLEEIEIPDSVTEIGEHSFESCKLLKCVKLLDNLIKIDGYAFKNCTNLEKIEIPDSVTEIGEFAFANCTSLEKIEIPDSVMEIGEGAFKNCRSLKHVKLSQCQKRIGGETFEGSGIFENCASLEKIEIPDSVTEIGESAFKNCVLLWSVKLSQNLNEIDKCAFANCTSLEEIEMPDGVKEIGEHTFRNCTALKIVKLSKNLEAIGKDAFVGCTALAEIKIPVGVIEIGDRAFAGCERLEKVWIGRNFRDEIERIFGRKIKDVVLI